MLSSTHAAPALSLLPVSPELMLCYQQCVLHMQGSQRAKRVLFVFVLLGTCMVVGDGAPWNTGSRCWASMAAAS